MTKWIEQLDLSLIFHQFLIIAAQIMIAVIGYYLIRFVGKKIILSSFAKLQKKHNMKAGRVRTLERLALNIFSYTLIFIFLTIIISLLGFDVTALIAGAGIAGLAIGFGAQGLVSDIVTGFFILLERQIEVEDYVTIANVDGIVEEIGLRTTILRGFDGTLHFIPNRLITNVKNHSRGNMRALVDISIEYDDDVDQAISIIQKACDKVAQEETTIKEGPKVLGIQSFGPSEVVIRVIAKTENMKQWDVESKLRKVIKKTLDGHGIKIHTLIK